MKYIPYESINGINFGFGENNIIETLGKPISVSKNKLEMKELNYEKSIYRLKENKVIEITSDIENIPLPDKNVTFKELKEFIAKNDKKSFDTVGFYVSPKYGIAFDPNHNSWVTMFCKSELKEWENIGEK